MKKNFYSIFVLAIFIAFGISSCRKESEIIPVENTDQTVEFSQSGDIIPGQYIVIFNETYKSAKLQGVTDYKVRQSIMKTEVKNFLTNKKVSADYLKDVYSIALNGFSAKLTDKELAVIQADENVSQVLPDRVYILKKPGTGDGDTGGSTQQVPWGITRVNGGVSGSNNVAWIIDTGIDLDHADLNVDVSRSATFVGTRTADDDNGHGSHVAGTIAAIDNTVGVIGVAAGASVVAVKVLDRRGSGAYSGVIAGVDYVAGLGAVGDVANMSLGGPIYEPIDAAVYNASQSSGVIFVLAAGNESDDANYHSPARVNGPKIFTISAMDINDNFAYFSNYGTPVDFCAPGVNILSTWKGGGYNTISGTSMASPHAAGVLLLGAARTDGTVSGDPDSKSDPIIVH